MCLAFLIVDVTTIQVLSRRQCRRLLRWSPKLVIVPPFAATSSVKQTAYVANVGRESQYMCTVYTIQKNDEVGICAKFAVFPGI